MYTYFKNTDIRLTVNSVGEVKFDAFAVMNLLSSRYTMPDKYKSIVYDILDNDKLRNMKNVDDISSVINSVVYQLNQTLVPIMRANIVNNSELKTILNLTKNITTDDFIIIYEYDLKRDNIFKHLTTDLTGVFRKLEKDGIIISENDFEVIRSVLDEFILNIGDEYSLIDIANPDKEKELHAEMKRRVLLKIEELLLERITTITLRQMLDTKASPMYMYYTEEGELVTNRDMIYPLLCAMEYYVYDDDNEVEPKIVEYIDRMEDEIANEVEIIVAESNLDKSKLSEMSPFVNISLLNRIKFIRENDIPPSKAINLRYPEALLSQLDLEGVFIDSIMEFLSIDSIIEDLQMATQLPRMSLETSAKQIAQEASSTYSILRDTDIHISQIYNGVRVTYMQMLDKKSEVLRKNHTSGTINWNSIS